MNSFELFDGQSWTTLPNIYKRVSLMGIARMDSDTFVLVDGWQPNGFTNELQNELQKYDITKSDGNQTILPKDPNSEWGYFANIIFSRTKNILIIFLVPNTRVVLLQVRNWTINSESSK